MDTILAEASVKSLIATYESYIKSYQIRSDPKQNLFDVSFTFLPYDYIDDDLDFDEFEYVKMTTHFKKWLETLLCNVAQDHPGTKVSAKESKMEFRDIPETPLEEVSFVFDPSLNDCAVRVTRQYWCKVT